MPDVPQAVLDEFNASLEDEAQRWTQAMVAEYAPSQSNSEPERYAFDASQERGKDGKWIGEGHAALSKLGDAAAKLEHVGKEVVNRQVNKLPDHLQSLVRGAWHMAMAGHTAAQAAVDAVAKAKGLTDEQRATVTRWTAAVNWVVGGKLLPMAAAAAGAGPLGAAISGFTPVGSAAYLAMSAATNPKLVLDTARQAIRDRIAGRGAKLDHAAFDLVDILAERSKLPDFDGWMALFLAAIDETEGDVQQSVSLADECQQPERYAAIDSPMEVLRRMPLEQQRVYASGVLAMLRAHPELRRSYKVEDLAYMEAIAGPQRYEKSLSDQIDDAAAETESNPSDEQKKAGNYRKGRVSVQDLPITIENARGSERSGMDKDGKPWSVTMNDHYGYIRRTESEADGDHVDVFLGPHPESEMVYVVDQIKPDGSFDEHKCMLGFTSADEAKTAYLANYSPGWKGFGGMAALPMAVFKMWLDHGDTGKPIAVANEPLRYSAHDVSDEARDESGKWTGDGDEHDESPADPGAEHPDDHDALKSLKGLYRNATSADFSHDAAEAKVKEIAKGLSGPALREIADKWDLVLPAKASKGAIAEAMLRRIFERRAFHQRTQINADQ